MTMHGFLRLACSCARFKIKALATFPALVTVFLEFIILNPISFFICFSYMYYIRR